MNSERLENIFKYQLKKDARTVSIATLLSDRYLRRITYNPYYQRNYVWEKDKKSFFIESVFLGTEIPPIVLFKKGTQSEVIDGRQRFETLKRFREDNFALHASGLMDLKALAGFKYRDLKSELAQLFDDTKIRIFEFEIVGMPDISIELEDKVKKEIFRRYNSGITPLTQSEVDNAKYDKDDLTDYYKEKLKKYEVFELIKKCFFPNANKDQKDLIIEMAALLRKLLILNKLPITQYAKSGKSILIEMMYDKFIQDYKEEYADDRIIKEQLLTDIKTVTEIVPNGNPNVYECLIWAINILREEGKKVDLNVKKEKIKYHYKNNMVKYATDSDHYYANVMTRFSDTADLMKDLYHVDFGLYLRNSSFSQEKKNLEQTEEEAELSMDRLSELRISKPNPASKPIDQILREVENSKYLIRPSYQRQEKINVMKASSIIESILLGIKLPPLFLYVRNDGIREVIDGQQRLLTVLGFLGRKYLDEEGKTSVSVNNCFHLKGLRILKEYNGKCYTDIIKDVEDTILDFDLDEIEIRQDLNPEFEPTDLFIRLNNKPYPIKPNSFEMWNSTCDKVIVEKIKGITHKYLDWFYLTIPKIDENGEHLDRMQNEELITILSYLCYTYRKGDGFEKVLGFYPRLEKFTCRIKTKSAITTVLDSFENKNIEKEIFLKSIDKTEFIINIIKNVLLDGNPSKDAFNKILNKKEITRFSRSYQEFYILWEILMNVEKDDCINRCSELKTDTDQMLCLLKNTEEKVVDDNYVNNFIHLLKSIQNKYL